MTITIYTGDCRKTLAQLPPESVHCCTTSPPYWAQRLYGGEILDWPEVSYSPLPGLPPITIPAQSAALGLEATLEAYVGHMVLIFREVRRVLRNDGTLWLNLGDSHNSQNGRNNLSKSAASTRGGSRKLDSVTYSETKRQRPAGLKPKDIMGVPWRVAFALQADGWYLRLENIWHKTNARPESVKDRPTRAHESVFLLTKAPRYFYDRVAIATPVKDVSASRAQRELRRAEKNGIGRREVGLPGGHEDRTGAATSYNVGERIADSPQPLANRRSVWPLCTAQFPGNHFAVMPTDLVEICVKAGTSEAGCCPCCGTPYQRELHRSKPRQSKRNPNPVIPYTANGENNDGNGATTLHMVRDIQTVGWWPTCQCQDETDEPLIPIPCTVLDPFGGRGTVGLVAHELGHDAILCELNEEYVRMSAEWLRETAKREPEIVIIPKQAVEFF